MDYPNSNGSSSDPVGPLFADYAELLLTRFEGRPDLQVIWAMERLLTRMVKRTVVSNRTLRAGIAADVRFERYLRPEEEIAFLGPCPARSVIAAVEAITLAELGAFVARHLDQTYRAGFNTLAAFDEYTALSARFEPNEAATSEEYHRFLQASGEEWNELTFADYVNLSWDKLGAGVCGTLLQLPETLQLLSPRAIDGLTEMASLGVSHAVACPELMGRAPPTVHADAKLRLERIFHPIFVP